MNGCQLCAIHGPRPSDTAIGRLLRPGQHPLVGATDHAAAIPTIGAFVAGYLLVVPRLHTLSLGALSRRDLAGVNSLAQAMIARLRAAYRRPVLGFEYGLNVTGGRRIGHAHLHLLPSDAALANWVDDRLPGYEITSLTQLPDDSSRSYITVWSQNGTITVHPVANDATPRIRLREVVANLDPALPADRWDWQRHPCPRLIRQTIQDLTAATTRHDPARHSTQRAKPRNTAETTT